MVVVVVIVELLIGHLFVSVKSYAMGVNTIEGGFFSVGERESLSSLLILCDPAQAEVSVSWREQCRILDSSSAFTAAKEFTERM